MEIYFRSESISVESEATHSTRKSVICYGGYTVMFVILSHSMNMMTYITVISHVNSSLNGTEVECTDLEDQESSTTIIRVLNAQGITIISH